LPEFKPQYFKINKDMNRDFTNNSNPQWPNKQTKNTENANFDHNDASFYFYQTVRHLSLSKPKVNDPLIKSTDKTTLSLRCALPGSQREEALAREGSRHLQKVLGGCDRMTQRSLTAV
jgi:hypothetical protein